MTTRVSAPDMRSLSGERAPRRPRAAGAVLWLCVAAVVAGLAWHGPIHQPAHYHDFADTRTWLGIPNAADVLSNLPFLAVGAVGLATALRLPANAPSRAAWGLFFAAVMLTTFGSAFYHWAPDTVGLAVDRLPIAWACAWLSLALLAERVDARLGRPLMQAIGLAAATWSVWAWYQGEAGGHGDLRAYLFVQFLPVLLIPLVCGVYRGGLLCALDWHGAIALYLLAKTLELWDAPIFAAVGMVSGHTLKHLVAALAALWLAWRLARRADALLQGAA